MKYRSRSEIIELLLNAADGGGATKTKLMYSAFISFNQLKEYLSLLAENGLIRYEDGTTEKGLHFLKLQNKIDELAPISFISEKYGTEERVKQAQVKNNLHQQVRVKIS